MNNEPTEEQIELANRLIEEREKIKINPLYRYSTTQLKEELRNRKRGGLR